MSRTWVGFSLGCAMALWSPGARAYVRTVTSTGAPMFWNRTVLNIEAYVGDPPAPLTAQDVTIAVKGAADAWSRDRVGCTSIELRVTSSLAQSAPVQLDGVSRLTFRRDAWCKEPRSDGDPCYDPLALAVTSVFARKSDGEIVDADVELNAVNFQWSDLVRRSDTGNLQDLQNTLTHELGHFIGLDHTCNLAGGRAGQVDSDGQAVPSCSDASDAVRATTMFAAVIPGDLERRSLSPDDRRAVCEIYPTLDLTLEAAQPAGCAVAPRRGEGPATVAAGGLLALIVSVRRRRARPATGSPSSTDPSPHR
jgi:hypothetical protein